MRILPDKHGPSFRTTDHGIKCDDEKGTLISVLCGACSKPGQRRWAFVEVACANGDRIEIWATARKTWAKTIKRKGKR